MADDYAGERTEQATPRRRQEARERGQVARSADLSAALGLLAGLLLLQAFGDSLLGGLVQIQTRYLSRLADPHLTTDTVVELFSQGAAIAGWAMAPVVLGLLAVGLAVNFLQIGALFTWTPLEPQWERLDPIAGFQRLFSGGAVVRLAMSLLKLAAIGWVAWRTIADHLPAMGSLTGQPVGALVALGSQIIFLMGIRIACLLLFLGILDYGWQRFDHERGLRMTKQEMKEEMKRMEGDPQLRARRLQIARQLSRQRMMKKVPLADVVITNPTEIAVAIQYDPTMPAPKVVAKGQRLLAERIRALAVEHGVPIVERKPLARALFFNVEVDAFIPEEHFAAVIEVLQFVFLLDQERYRRKFLGAGV